MSLEQKSPFDNSVPRFGKLAGIDFGTVRIGIAICDPSQTLASPFENYDRRSPTKDDAYFRELASEERIVGWVVGLPLHTDGKESQKSIEAKAFGQRLMELTRLPVDYCDERFTSVFAEEVLSMGGMSRKKKKKRLDMIAAQIMLTAYLESKRASTSDAMPKKQPSQNDLADDFGSG